MATPCEYLVFLGARVECPHCHWNGPGVYLGTGDPTSRGIEKFCPVCLDVATYAPWPVTDDIPNDEVARLQDAMLRLRGNSPNQPST